MTQSPNGLLPVYAHVEKYDMGDGFMSWSLTTTYKPYFDICKCMDDGTSNDVYPSVMPFDAILDGLQNAGLAEASDSEFDADPEELELPDDIPSVQAKLKRLAAAEGIDLIFNDPGFDGFLAANG